jgi:hypothetical protein
MQEECGEDRIPPLTKPRMARISYGDVGMIHLRELGRNRGPAENIRAIRFPGSTRVGGPIRRARTW